MVNVVYGQPQPFQRLGTAWHRAITHDGRINPGHGHGAHYSHGLQAKVLSTLGRHDNHGRSAVSNLGRGASGHGAFGVKGGLEAG